MKKSGPGRDTLILKYIALGFALLIITSSVSVTDLTINYQSIKNLEISDERDYQTRNCKVTTILTYNSF